MLKSIRFFSFILIYLNLIFYSYSLETKKSFIWCDNLILGGSLNGQWIEAKNILVEGTFYDHIEKRADGFYYPGIFTHKVFNFLDLNSDGTLEIITGNREFEGYGYSVYEIKNGKSIQVLDNGWGV